MDRPELLALLGEVAAVLDSRRVSGRLYVVGGAAMALAYDAARTTRDLDGVVLDGYGEVMAAARVVAARHGLAPTWLNEQASAYVPRGDDARPVVVFDAPGLRVLAASAERMLVMKAQAARATDLADIRLLADRCGAHCLDDVIALVADLMPDQPLGERSRAVLAELFDHRTG